MIVMPVTTTVYQTSRQDAAAAPSPSAVMPQSGGVVLEISDEAWARIDAFKAGTTSLEQAVRESRQQACKAALDRVAMAHDYLRLLKSMSSPDDPAAAREAARVAGEIRNAAVSYGESLTREDKNSLRSETAALVSTAGKALAISREIVQRYLQHRKRETEGNRKLLDEVDDARRGLDGLMNDGVGGQAATDRKVSSGGDS